VTARRNKGRAPSLYRVERGAPPRPTTTAQELLALLWQTTPAVTIARNLELIERAAAAADRDGLTEHARTIRKYLDLLTRARKAGVLDAAIVEAMNLAGAFERLRTDALLAAPVDSYRRGRAKPVTPDAAIIERLAARKPGERLADVAASLRMSERQLRARRNLIEEKRKSVRPPPPK
jgi:hypothetical protein